MPPRDLFSLEATCAFRLEFPREIPRAFQSARCKGGQAEFGSNAAGARKNCWLLQARHAKREAVRTTDDFQSARALPQRPCAIRPAQCEQVPGAGAKACAANRRQRW